MNVNNLHKTYLIIFGKSGFVTNYNSKQQLQGEILKYQDGILLEKLNYINGVVNGWVTIYYKSGKINYSIHYLKNKQTGKQYQYYENGQLKSSSNFKNGKLIGSSMWYTEDGILDLYMAYDVYGNCFSTFNFNKSGNIIKSNGPAVCGDTYSINKEDNSLILFNFDSYKKNRLSKIQDLYINVSTPPTTKLDVIVKINNTIYKDLKIKDNLVVVSNAFPTLGNYEVFIETHLFDNSDKIINGGNVKYNIGKTFYRK